ncbi:MAG TPA: methyltransferase domain-containing protein, partial [Acidimicrobiales bacterium]|nr:methyltransferase domain-containing protein [Acidimicrobiales bacterium]
MEPESREHYPITNDSVEEEQRLTLHQQLYDPITIGLFETIGVGEGWRCAELGAGRGSIAAWMSGAVGPSGSVRAIDRDITQLGALRDLDNVEIVEADLDTYVFPDAAFDLMHTRAVLMHLEDPPAVLSRMAKALAPGGYFVLQEADGLPSEGPVDAPPAYLRTMTPIARRWTAARHFADQLRDLGLVDVRHQLFSNPVRGATPRAVFWLQTLDQVTTLLGRGNDPQWMADVAEVR